MKTTKACSTISYNTLDFLKDKLDKLVRRRYISFYAFVKHYAEEDERKDHIHLIVIPNGQIQTDTISDILQELDSANPLKQLGVMPWRSSKWADWYLYSSHDKAYLASKGQSRTHHYAESDFITSDSDYLHELITTIDRTKYAKTQEFVQNIMDGGNMFDMVVAGQVPVAPFTQWQPMERYLKANMPFRNGRTTHTPDNVDHETGEVSDD